MGTLRSSGPGGSFVGMSHDRSDLTWFAGWDVRGRRAGERGAAEVLALPKSREMGAVEVYELLAVAARGFRPPEILTIVQSAGEDQPPNHKTEHESRWPDGADLRQAWSLLYHPIAESNPRKITPYAIYLLGVNPPADTTDEDLETFNDFYTNVHLREVAERRHALRAVRYELVRNVKDPVKGAPRFLALYEVDQESASQRRHVGPPYSPGPPVWQGHRTPWRLWFRTAGDLE
jgi:hypothetical protein